MSSQWQSFLQNLGEWEGSFDRFSPSGELLESVRSVISFQASQDLEEVTQVNSYYPEGKPPTQMTMNLRSLNRSLLFFPGGGFSQGSLFYPPLGEFGAELGLIDGDRRLRLVFLFQEGKLTQLTLILETRAGTSLPPLPQLTPEQLIGTWQGEATTLYPDWRNPDLSSTTLTFIGPPWQQTLSSGSYHLSSSATYSGAVLDFNNYQVLLLPGGASATFPKQITRGQPFHLEVGWLVNPNHRFRMLRNYNEKGEWSSLTLIEEHL